MVNCVSHAFCLKQNYVFLNFAREIKKEEKKEKKRRKRTKQRRPLKFTSYLFKSNVNKADILGLCKGRWFYCNRWIKLIIETCQRKVFKESPL